MVGQHCEGVALPPSAAGATIQTHKESGSRSIECQASTLEELLSHFGLCESLLRPNHCMLATII